MLCSHFHLTLALPTPGRASGIPSGLSTPPINLSVSRNKLHSALEGSVATECPPEAAKTPTNLIKKGSFHYDWVCSGYLMEWAGPAEFEVWCREEHLTYSIELIAAGTLHGGKL